MGARHGSILAAFGYALVAAAASAAPQAPAASSFDATPLPEARIGLLILAALAIGFWRGRS